MELIILTIVALCAAIVAVFFYLKSRQHADDNSRNREELSQANKLLDDERKRAVVLETQLDLIRGQLEEHKQNQSKTEQLLKEQLELMGKEMLMRGTQVLRSENQQQLAQFLAPVKEKALKN